MNTSEAAVLSGFWQKNGLGSLGVKHMEKFLNFLV